VRLWRGWQTHQTKRGLLPELEQESGELDVLSSVGQVMTTVLQTGCNSSHLGVDGKTRESRDAVSARTPTPTRAV